MIKHNFHKLSQHVSVLDHLSADKTVVAINFKKKAAFDTIGSLFT